MSYYQNCRHDSILKCHMLTYSMLAARGDSSSGYLAGNKLRMQLQCIAVRFSQTLVGGDASRNGG